MFVTGLVTLLSLLLLSPSHGNAVVKQYPRVARAERPDRILIIAPHIDDESIGAGGYALDAIANGAEVYVVFLTAGDCNRFSARLLNKTLDPTASNFLAVGRRRIAEAHDAMRLLGVRADHYFILGYPDRGLKQIVDDRTAVVRSRGTWQRAVPYEEAMSPGSAYRYENLMADVERVIAIARPTTVIAPVAFDLHPDHAAAATVTDRALADMRLEPRRLGYLVHTSRIPTSLVRMPERALVPPARMRSYTWATYPLTPEVQKRKDTLLQTYQSQRPYLSILRNAFVRTNELFYVR
jgi:LmbE family N-acetylglucosaminyl deacetylase